MYFKPAPGIASCFTAKQSGMCLLTIQENIEGFNVESRITLAHVSIHLMAFVVYVSKS